MDEVEAEKKAALAAGMSYMPMDQPEDESVEEEAAPPQPLSRDQILGAQDRPIQPINVPRWGVVCIRTLTVAERTELLEAAQAMGDGPAPPAAMDLIVKMVVLSAADEDGARLFTDADMPALREKSSLAMEALADEIRRLNGMGEDAVEEAEKN